MARISALGSRLITPVASCCDTFGSATVNWVLSRDPWRTAAHCLLWLTAWRGFLACLLSAVQPGSLLILLVFSFTVFGFSFCCHTLSYEHFTTVFLRAAQQQLHTHKHMWGSASLLRLFLQSVLRFQLKGCFAYTYPSSTNATVDSWECSMELTILLTVYSLVLWKNIRFVRKV